MAGDYIITGGRPLNGTVRVPAAKNSVLPLLAASLLCSGPVRLCGVPELADVAESLALLRSAGCTAERQGGGCAGGRGARQRDAGGRPGGPDAGIHPVLRPAAGPAGPGTDRAARGCRIGARPIDLHLAGLVQMGACPQLEGERLLLTAPAGLHGADITLRFPSVGATETLLLAAALAQGGDDPGGAAREPEIEDLAAFLNRCGGRVQGRGHRHGAGAGGAAAARMQLCAPAGPDHGSHLCLCPRSGWGRVELAGCARPGCMRRCWKFWNKWGAALCAGAMLPLLPGSGGCTGGRVFTGAYPALATDAAPAAGGGAALRGGTRQHRGRHLRAAVRLRGRLCGAGRPGAGGGPHPVCGTRRHPAGTVLEAPDLRGGAALVIAALAAQGSSRITHTEFIDRGYADFAQKLTALGGQIARETPRGADCPKKELQKRKFDLHSRQKR